MTFVELTAEPVIAPTLDQVGLGLAKISSLQQPLSSDSAEVSTSSTIIVISSVTVITGISSLLAGLVTVGLPTIAKDLNLAPNLLLWPASIFSLTCGCTLLLSGSVADLVGSRIMYLIGSALQSVFTVACGLSKTGTQLIVFRGLAGIATSLCLPSAVSIITGNFPPGKRRNVAFASMGSGQPIGFSIGLTLGGVFAETIGWQWGFYIAAIVNLIIFLLALWGLPKSIDRQSITWSRVANDIDWVGATVASTSLALLSYVLAAVTGNTSDIHDPQTITLLVTGLALIPGFIFWMSRQERLGRPALIPNSLWRNQVFSSICLCVFLTWGAFNAVENILTFVLQYVQSVPAMEASVRFLPGPVCGALTELAMGFIVDRFRADFILAVGLTLTSVSPLVMALVNPKTIYWAYEFPAVALNPIGADALFTISNLLITSMFPEKTQALAGGVFNTVAQVGKSVGLATSAVIASTITDRSHFEDKSSPEALLIGYKAAFWYCFALSLTTLFISGFGLRAIGKIGLKRD